MKKLYDCFLLFALLISTQNCFSQSDKVKPVKVAVFIPLFIDTVYNGSVYGLGKATLPKSVLPGLEFYNGVMMAIDSLNKEGSVAEINIYDSKQTSNSLISVLSGAEMNDVGLIIAAITNPAEQKVFAEYSLAQGIPIISATYPNNVGVKENPFFVMLNTSLEGHLQGLQKYMQKNYKSDSIIAITRKDGQYEAFIKNYFTSLNQKSGNLALKLKWVNMDEKSLSFSSLQSTLDTIKNNIIFVASPMEKFGLDIVKMISSNERYKSIAIGMPTWDNLKDLDRSSCRNVEIIYSTPFVYSRNKTLNESIFSRYKSKFYSRPSDMVYKGYEVLFHFTKLLIKHKTNLINNLDDKEFTVFNEFKPEPVRLYKTSTKPDLLENKKLYFIRKQQGNLKGGI